METNKIYQGNCKEIMKTFPANCIDLTVTSPPYDNLRSYNGYDFDFEGIADQLFRITKPGGVVVWVVGDATVKGSETGSSFKQALYFIDIGFKLHDTMIYQKDNCPFPSSNRYYANFEYMFVFVKGHLKTFNPIADRKNKSFGRKISGTNRSYDGTTKKISNCGKAIKEFGVRFNCWLVTEGKRQKLHPAPFPEKLASDHIISWSNKSDIIFDPMCGSGTTLKMAQANKRNFVGIDISEEYVSIAKQRCGVNPLIS